MRWYGERGARKIGKEANGKGTVSSLVWLLDSLALVGSHQQAKMGQLGQGAASTAADKMSLKNCATTGTSTINSPAHDAVGSLAVLRQIPILSMQTTRPLRLLRHSRLAHETRTCHHISPCAIGLAGWAGQ